MGRGAKILPGERFGRLLAVSSVDAAKRRRLWLCRCDCGKEATVSAAHLRSGGVKSCGCLKFDSLSARAPDLTGQRFGRLTAIRRDGRIRQLCAWICRCDCGNEVRTNTNTLRCGHTRSCGCLKRERTGDMSRTHGRSQTPLYRVWRAMVTRCTNANAIGYLAYGAKGIRVSDRWRSFENFLADMGERPSPRHSLDRIDPLGHYEPGNVRWATTVEQARNKATTQHIEHGGERRTIADWAGHLGLSVQAIKNRITRGWPIEKVLTAKAGHNDKNRGRDGWQRV